MPASSPCRRGNGRRSSIRPPTKYRSLRLAETLTAFLQRLRQSAETLEIAERQKVVPPPGKGKSWSTMTLHHDPALSILFAQPTPARRRRARRRQPANCGYAVKVLPFAFGACSRPLLSNLVLDDLDKELTRRGLRFCRYADDANIYVRSRRAGERVMASVSRFLTQKLRLRVNEAKSAVQARPEERKFLGFSIANDGSERRTSAPKALDKFKAQIRDTTRRTRGISLTRLIEDLTPYLLRWRGYFGFCQTPRVLTNLEAWIRRRLRFVSLAANGKNGPQPLPGTATTWRARSSTAAVAAGSPDRVLAHVRTPGGPTGPAQLVFRRPRSPPPLCSCSSLTRSNRRGTDPYARWCGRGGTARGPPIPICGASSSFERAVSRDHEPCKY